MDWSTSSGNCYGFDDHAVVDVMDARRIGGFHGVGITESAVSRRSPVEAFVFALNTHTDFLWLTDCAIVHVGHRVFDEDVIDDG